MSRLSPPSVAEFKSSSGHPGVVVGLDDGELDGASDGCIDKLGDVVGPEDGELEGKDVDGIDEGLVDGGGFGGLDGAYDGDRLEEGDCFVTMLPSLFVVDWLMVLDGLSDGAIPGLPVLFFRPTLSLLSSLDDEIAPSFS
mmetsp:Transcript_23962/g.51729  ORF Transcript_23962/g.51729 Transcript_23962/m.51729 type:complete len:140 (+) Transcript_23962:375-794(+)